MIPSSPTAKFVSLGLAVAALAGAVLSTTSDVKTEIAGGGQPAEAMMGSAFEDMTAGTLTSEPAEELSVTPTVTAAPEAPQPPKEAPTPTQSPAPAVATASPSVTTPTDAPAPVESSPIPKETVTAQDPQMAAPPQSARPKRRDPELAAKAEAARPKQKVAKAKAAPKKTTAPQGNSNRNNTKGATSGTRKTAAAQSQGHKQKSSSQSGNAAASNYPGVVMKRISRVRKPRVNSRGTAVVSFAITSSGALARVSVANSSGSAPLDRAAMNVIRKAAPFPAPPSGAQRQFSIRIKGS